MDIILYIIYFLLKVLALFGSLMKSAQRPKEVPVGAKAGKSWIKNIQIIKLKYYKYLIKKLSLIITYFAREPNILH